MKPCFKSRFSYTVATLYLYTEPNHTINLQYLVGWRLDGGREENGLDDAWHGRRHDLATKKAQGYSFFKFNTVLNYCLYLLRASVTISGNVDFQASIAGHSDVVRLTISIGGHRPVDSNERKEGKVSLLTFDFMSDGRFEADEVILTVTP